ncbi:hypothetical protein AOQ84DRAFT_385551 [Glonium stellatum]|uniref:Heterokaryon incompatibility domain-containing protein n=1 Tax=Glonium stellatum TaxID=574774 RepID=A0A8E2F9U0_9PEZI|nr:hypothetical protein AOQ84DRAFT_385551 [Glonium stellatum]
MRLLNSSTFELREFVGSETPPYVILSHTWEEEEVSFKDIQGLMAAQKEGFTKIINRRAQAVKDGFKWVWIDTRRIDKTSSAELTEAINSMYHWYKHKDALRKSKWFTRGWTLQELIAPSLVEFYDSNWTEIGTKATLEDFLTDKTGIPREALRGGNPSACNVVQRMQWASRRVTTRIEDRACCLMGLFDVNMPLLYGEGEKAFFRLQEQILKFNVDYSLFLWKIHNVPPERGNSEARFGMLANSPRDFCGADRCDQCFYEKGLAYQDLILDSTSARDGRFDEEFRNIHIHFASQKAPLSTGRGLHHHQTAGYVWL